MYDIYISKHDNNDSKVLLHFDAVFLLWEFENFLSINLLILALNKFVIAIIDY